MSNVLSRRAGFWTLACAAVLPVLAWGAPTSNQLLDALRNGDRPLIERLIKVGASVDATDEFGASALMYAALYCEAPVVRLLLDRGANPNHADRSGATALMWAVPDEAKVRFLVRRDAQVNVSSPLSGRTPLLIAAGRPGAASTVKLLLRAGANAQARDRKRDTPLLRAAYSGDVEIFRQLVDRDVEIDAKGDFQLTALMEAFIQGNRQMIELLLAKGADPRVRDQDGFTVLTSALSFRDPTLFRLLIGKGADPGARSSTGLDLLMAAAASDTTSTEMIEMLRSVPVDPQIAAANFHTQHGFGSGPERPMDWAARRGETPVSLQFARWTGVPVVPGRPGEEARLHAVTPRAAIGRAMQLLMQTDIDLFRRGGCVSCHHNMLPAIAYSLAHHKGIALDEEKIRRNRLQIASAVRPLEDDLLQDIRFPSGDLTAAYLLAGLEAGGHPRDRTTDALVQHLAASQAVDGGWRVRTDRPPLESGRASVTALSIRALRRYGFPGRKREFDTRISRAAAWLVAYPARTGEEKAMRLAGMAWAGAPLPSIQQAAARLSATQREDGGWAQLDTLPSDAYATGQALYALQSAGLLSDEALRKGVRFLLDSQLADGSWHVRSRSYPIQSNYFDTGFKHGRDQWISAAGTSWACIGLSLAVQ